VFGIDPANAWEAHNALLEKYGVIYSDYIEDVLHTGGAENPMTAALLMQFTTDPVWRGLQAYLITQFADLSPYEAELGNALKRYAVFFNQKSLPQLVAYNSGYNVGVYPTEQWLGVGLEWFSGTDHKWVNQLPPALFPQYKREKMKQAYLVPNVLRGWLLFNFREMRAQDQMLAEMIFAGKAAYLTQVLLEEADEGRVMNYSAAQRDWCQQNEYAIWKTMVERDLVFSTDLMEINKMISDGPFTPGMPQESPGGVGRWLGYRMVQQFMDKQTDMGLAELMNYSDNRMILKAYKPGR
jgi:hypothetical protein